MGGYKRTMKRKKLYMAAIMLAFFALPMIAQAKEGPVKITAMTRVESHSKVSDSVGNYSGESYEYTMISLTRSLDKNVLGNLFYLNQYGIDKGRMLTHIGGVNLIYVFNPRMVGTFGYSYSSNPENTANLFVVPLENQDKFSSSLLYTLNPKSKGLKYSFTTGYSTKTAWNKSRVLTEKANVTFPIFNKKWMGDVAYTFSSGMDKDAGGNRIGHLTNQYTGNLTYKLCKQTKMQLGGIYINKLYNNAPDDMIWRLSVNYSFN